MSFPLIKLGDLFEIQIGKTPSRANQNYWTNGLYNWLSIADMNQGKYLDRTKEKINDLAIKESNIKLIPENTVVLSYKLSIGKVGITKKSMFTNEAIASLIPLNNNIDINFLYWALQHIDLMANTDRAAMGQTLNKAKLKEIKIPLLPLSEQKRIAQILDKADEIRQKRQQSIEKLDELLQATFIDMFGDPVTNPKGWKVKKLADLGSIATGNTPPRANPENYGNFMEWIKSDNLNHSFDYATKATEYLSEIGAKKARVVPSGTILVTCIAGSFDCIGNLAIVDREVAFNQQINSLTPNDENDTLFLYYLLKISKHIIQSSSTKSMKGMISKSKFSEITLPIPPFEEQIKFSKVFENFNSLKKTALSQLEHQENLFQSLQQRAFKGEL